MIVEVVMQEKEKDEGVKKEKREILDVEDKKKKMMEMGEEKVGEYISKIGIWRKKEKNVIMI